MKDYLGQPIPAEAPVSNTTEPRVAHTPGPWTIEPNVNRGAWIGRDSKWAALSCGDTDEEAAANARLIAAAPDLLVALKALVALTVNPHDGGEFEDGEFPTLDAARAAIAKATGEPS